MDLSDTDSSTTGEIESPTASDNDSSSSHSPHVVSKKGTRMIGEIKLIFKHSFKGETRNLLQVDWFSSIVIDPESKLVMIDTKSETTTTIVTIDDLGRPLIHAYEDDKLYVLNFH